MKIIEQSRHPEFTLNDANYKILKNSDGEFFVEIEMYGSNLLNDRDWKLFFDVIGVELIEWLDFGGFAKVSLHFPESTYGS